MKRIFVLLKGCAVPLTISFVFLVLSTLCSIALPTLMTNVVDYGITTGDMGYVYQACFWMTVVTFADVVFKVGSAKIGNDALFRFSRDLGDKVFDKVLSMPPTQWKQYGTGALLTRTLEDVERISDVTGSVIALLASIPVTLIAGTVLAFKKSATLACVMLAFTPVVLLVVFLCSRRTHKNWRVAEEQIDKQNALVRSRLTGIRVVRAFNQEDTEQAKIVKATRLMSKEIVKGNMLSELIAPISMFVLNVATVLIIFLGAREIASPDLLLTAGGVLAVIEYVGMITSGLLSISYLLGEIPRFRINCARVGEVLATEDEN